MKIINYQTDDLVLQHELQLLPYGLPEHKMAECRENIRSGYVENYYKGVKALPNTSNFETLSIPPYDPTLESAGIHKRILPTEFGTYPHNNGGANKYLSKQFKKLIKYAKQGTSASRAKFWALAFLLIGHSASYLMSGVNFSRSGSKNITKTIRIEK